MAGVDGDRVQPRRADDRPPVTAGLRSARRPGSDGAEDAVLTQPVCRCGREVLNIAIRMAALTFPVFATTATLHGDALSGGVLAHWQVAELGSR